MDIKSMYRRIVKDDFPETIVIEIGESRLVYKKKVWTIYNEDEKREIERGLRYGENPDQKAALYELINGNLVLGDVRFLDPERGLVSKIKEEDMLQFGKHPGKINLTDVDNALNILKFLDKKPACAIMKHNNPCGVAYGSTVSEAFERAFWADRIAAFGGAVVFNRPVDREAASLISRHYFEVICAPEYEGGALDILKKWKNLRILRIEEISRLHEYKFKRFIDIKSLMDGGLIIQESQPFKITGKEDLRLAEAIHDGEIIRILRPPTEKEYEDMIFGWYVESGVTSNSVLFVKDEATVSIGTGEQDRVGVVEITVFKAYKKFIDREIYKRFGIPYADFKKEVEMGLRKKKDLLEIEELAKAENAGLRGSSMCSDGFFPFRDGVDVALDEGVTAIIQPGGSERDHEVIRACNERNATMVFTGQRLFKH